MPRSHLFLIGYRGSGKSSVGRILASCLNRPFVDTDDWVEQTAAKSIAQIFADSGETAFRDLETSALVAVVDADASVIALGGGAILRPENRTMIQSSGHAVWLQAAPERLAERIAADHTTQSRRPSLSPLGTLAEIERVLADREPIYREVADFAIHTGDLSEREVSERIAAWYATVG